MRTPFLALSLVLCAPVVAQEPDSTRLQREQNEILRKTQRLEDLMKRLMTRYERDGRTEQVRLLQEGLAHLEKSRLLTAAAAIPGQLDNGALDDALRDQAIVVEELEGLLDILLERQSIENLDQEIETTTQMIDRANELIQRQEELREQNRAAREDLATQAEREIGESLRDLANEQRSEAAENQRRAGLQMPVLEAAAQRIRALLDAQQELETDAGAQLSDQPDADRETAFELGSIEQAQRELMGSRGQQRDLQRLADAARQMQEATQGGDADRVREGYDRLRARVESNLADPELDAEARGELEAAHQQLRNTPTGTSDPTTNEKLNEIADGIRQSAENAEKRKGEANDKAQQELAERTRKAAKAEQKTDEQGKPRATPTSSALERAAKQMEQSIESSKKGASSEATSSASSALRQMADARRKFRDSNPSPTTRASDMASSADQVARNLRESPMAGETEQQAADALDRAEDALRQSADQLGQDESGEQDADRDAVEQNLGQSRQGLQEALQALQGAMQQAAQAESAAAEQAAQRQQELAQRADAVQQQLEQAQQNGDLSERQAQSAQRSVEAARQSMQQAQSQLQNGQPSSASNSQSRAADQLEQAAENLERNRPVSEDARERLQEVAREQEKLEEDIIDLAKLAEERNNRRAAEALQRAAEASRQAQRELEQGDPQDAEEQQQEAQEQLEQAREELQEERDRYMDLRQEELLFRIGEELTEFLEAQQPLTQQTREAGEAYENNGRLSRPERRKLNQVGERELELVTRTEFILNALVEEGVVVFSHALRANVDDLKEVAERLSGRRPDPSSYTVMLQEDVEMRARKLLEALERERQRREQERQQQQNQQQQQGENKFAQKEPLVPLIAELQMLKQMEEDMQTRTAQAQKMLDASGADGITELDVALIERLAHQHAALTKIFQQIKTGIEQAMSQEGGAEDPFEGDDGNKEKDK